MSKLNGLSLQDVIGEKKSKYEASIFTTFNVHLPFYEQIVLTHLKKAGCRANTLLIDSRQFSQAFNTESTKPRTAGREYTLLPIDVAGGVFHPKILVLAGKEKISFCVGSHNMTLSGFGKNREITFWHQINIDSPDEDIKLFQQVWNSLRIWTAEQPDEILRGFYFVEKIASWAIEKQIEDLAEPKTMFSYFSTSKSSPSLWEQVKSILPEKVRRVILIAPFFGEQISFLHEIQETLSPKYFVVGIEPETVQISTNAYLQMPDVRFVDTNVLRNGSGYLHAKSLLIETVDNQEVLIVGSANASRSAWLGGFGHKNYEAVVVIRTDIKNSFAKELGLKKLSELPALETVRWKLVKSPEKSVEHSPIDNLKVFQALALPHGFEISVSNQHLFIESPVKIFDSAGQLIDEVDSIVKTENKLSIPVDSPLLIQKTAMLEFADEAGQIFKALVHHPEDIARTLRTGKLQELCAALESFDTGLNEELIKLIEKFIFDESDLLINSEASVTESYTGGQFKTEKKSDEDENLQDEFSLPTALGRNNRLSQNLQGDSLTEILSFINRQLCTGKFSDSTVNAFRSEEDLIGSDDERLLNDIDQKARNLSLAALCRRKSKTMMNRMVNKMNVVSPNDLTASYVAFRQLITVLSFLCLLRQHEKIPSVNSPNEEFIEVNAEWNFFLDAVYYLFSARHNILKNARQYSIDDELIYFIEVQLLLIWLAYDIGFDTSLLNQIDKRKYQELNEDGWQIEEIIHAGARFLTISENLNLSGTEVVDRLSKFFRKDEELKWFNRNFEWLKRINSLVQNINPDLVIARPPRIGDFIKTRSEKVYLVLDNPGNILVVDLDSENEEKRFSRDFVQVLNFVS